MAEVSMDLSIYENLPIKTKEHLVSAVLMVEAGMARLRELKKQYEEELILLMDDLKIKQFEFEVLPEPLVVFRGEKKTERFDSEKLTTWLRSEKKADREAVISCLPKNPAWKKTEVLKLQEKKETLLHWQEVEPKIEITKIPKNILERGGKNNGNSQPNTEKTESAKEPV